LLKVDTEAHQRVDSKEAWRGEIPDRAQGEELLLLLM
jgi:hypothetical protein